MAKKRYVSDTYRCDTWIETLDPLERYLYLYLLTNQYVSVCWIYELNTKRMAFETWIEKEMIEKMLSRFQDAWKIIFNGWVLFIINFVKNQNIKNVDDNLRKWIKREILELWWEKLGKVLGSKGLTRALQGAYKDLPIPYLTLLNSTLLNLDLTVEKKIPKKKEKADNIKNKDFEKFWKNFPHARQWKKEEAKWYYIKLDRIKVDYEAKLLKRKVKAGIQDWNFIPACQRRVRDFTPISEAVKEKDFKQIIGSLKELKGADRTATHAELVKDFGNDVVNKYRELSKKKITLNFKK